MPRLQHSGVRGALDLQRLAGNRATTAALSAPAPGVGLQRQEHTVGEVCTAPAQEEPNQSLAPEQEADHSAAPTPEEAVCKEPLHVLTYQGRQYAIPESQWTGFLTGLKQAFRKEVLRPIESRMGSARGFYDAMVSLNDEHSITAWFLEAARFGINLEDVTPLIHAGERALQHLRTLTEGNDLAAIEAATWAAQEAVDEAYRAIHEYRERQISAGETTIVALQVTETACFTVFAVAGGAVLAAPVAAGGLGLGVLSSGAIIGGGTALLSSATGVGAKAVYGDEVGWADVKNVAIDTVVGAAGGAAGGAVAAKLGPYLAPALSRSLRANGLFHDVAEETLTKAVGSVVSGSAGSMVGGAITDGMRVLRGQATMDDLLRNVVVNLVVGGIGGLVGQALAGKAGGQPPVTVKGQSRQVRVSNPELLNRYEQAVNKRLPDVIREALAKERPAPTANRARLATLRTDFDTLRAQVGDAPTLTPQQRQRATQILREARKLADDEYGALRGKIWARLNKKSALNQEIHDLEKQLIDAGDARRTTQGALEVKVVRGDPGHEIETFESLNLEHKIRKSDNPWLAKDPRNLTLTDAPQNQEYLEGLRKHGSIWPTDAVEEFVLRFQLNDEGVDFAPRSR